jgi:putative transposase
VSPTLSYVYRRDYSLQSGQQVSLLTLSGRIHVPYQGYDEHLALLHKGPRIGGARLWYDRSKKRFYLLVAIEIETLDPAPAQVEEVIGIDVGQRYLATVTTTTGSAQFSRGKEVRQQADHYAHLQKRLQQKGTRSATRRQIVLKNCSLDICPLRTYTYRHEHDHTTHTAYPSGVLYPARARWRRQTRLSDHEAGEFG